MRGSASECWAQLTAYSNLAGRAGEQDAWWLALTTPVRRWIAVIIGRRRICRDIDKLLELDDHMLADIGLDRDFIEYAAWHGCLPVWWTAPEAPCGTLRSRSRSPRPFKKMTERFNREASTGAPSGRLHTAALATACPVLPDLPLRVSRNGIIRPIYWHSTELRKGLLILRRLSRWKKGLSALLH